MRIGIDTGGTFTDVVVADGGRLLSFKVPSTPRDPSTAILGALATLPGFLAGARDPSGGVAIIHGSTVATNALLEGKTARAALITTAGFEDVLEIGRQARPSLYDIEVRRPRPLVPRELRYGVPERILATGAIRTPLDPAAVRAAGEAASRAGAASVAVCFLHSYLNAEHEEEAARLLSGLFPGTVTVSSGIVREFREYERFSTAVVNAAVVPIMTLYLRRLEEAVAPASIRVMGSDGGAVSAARASCEAVRTVLSGPAAGVVAAQRVCAAAGIPRAISFDMGGTSTDVSLIPGGIILTGDTVLAGYPIRTPTIDIHTVGAGGGSIAWIDPGGALKVGPQSAGADPGPACYGRGGPPTVTDANLLLGRILADRFLDGKMPLDAEAAARGIGALAGRLGLDLERTASGILEIANVTMARAVRQVSLFRGHDPARFTLCAFGGAGGLHALPLADVAGIPEALVPPSPGVLSAWGLLAGDVLISRSATILRGVRPGGETTLEDVFTVLEFSASEALFEESRLAGVPAEPRFERLVEARYRGQSHEIAVDAADDWAEAFHRAHLRHYGFDGRGEEVVAVTARVVGRLPVDPPPLPCPFEERAPAPASRPRRVWDAGAWRDGRAVERSTLRPGAALSGPAVITEAGATTWVPSGAEAAVTGEGSVRLRRRS